MQFKSAKFFKSNKQKPQIMEKTYISKKGYFYPVYGHSGLGSQSQKIVSSVIDVLKSSKGAKVKREGRTLFSRWAEDTELLLFIEKNNEGEVVDRFAIDLTK